MSQQFASAVYGSYNARSTTPEDVAERFVDPPQFWEILSAGNTVLTGPRGSGKTTLLKMLQGPALERWQGPRADEARAAVQYSGVFVPADRSWSGQVVEVGKGLGDDELRTRLGRGCFALHTLRALAQCAHTRTKPTSEPHSHGRVEIDPSDEEELVRSIWRGWGLQEPVGSLAALRYALSDLLRDIGSLARRALHDRREHERLSAHPALDIDIIDAAIPFIERFNGMVNEEGHIWAFLIDEIEFLPPGIQNTIVHSMRGRDPLIIQKVSVAPYTSVSTELSNPLGGWEGHDLQRVELTFSEKEGGYDFSKRLARRELQDLRNSDDSELDVREILGGSGSFENPPGKDAYGQGSRNQDAIKSLVGKDESFARWVARMEINVADLESVSGERRAATLRKAIPIILLRDEFIRKNDDEGLAMRSRKHPRTYLGEESAYAICENNPRLLKALIARLLRRREDDRLSDATRAEVLEQACREYELHLRAIEVARAVDDELLPRKFVAAVGESLAAGVFDAEFDPEPPLSFSVSERDLQHEGLPQVITQLAHYGAVVQVAENRFRLAHMFAPVFRLPLRRGRERALTNMIWPSGPPPLPPTPPPEGQLEIGSEE